MTATVSLGTFGETHDDSAPLDADFEWFGKTIRVDPDFSELDLMEFMDSAGGLDEDDSAAIPALMRMLRACVHPGDWREFWSLARKNRQQMPDFLKMVYAVIEAATDRPTVRPADSTGGPARIGISSTPASSSADDRAFELLKDRGDLGAVILMRREWEASQVPATA